MDKIPPYKRKSEKVNSNLANSTKSRKTPLKRLDLTKKPKITETKLKPSPTDSSSSKSHISSVVVRPKRNNSQNFFNSNKSRFSPRFYPPNQSSNPTTSSEDSESNTNSRTETEQVPIHKRIRQYRQDSSDSEQELTSFSNKTDKSDSLVSPQSSRFEPKNRLKVPPPPQKKIRIFESLSDRKLRDRKTIHSKQPIPKPRYQIKTGNSSTSLQSNSQTTVLNLKPSKQELNDKPTSSRSKRSMDKNQSKPDIDDYIIEGEYDRSIPDDLPSDDILAPHLSVLMQQGTDHPNKFMEFLRSIGRGPGASDDSLGQVVAGIQEGQDEDTQYNCLVELTQMLLLGSEETLGGLPIKVVVPALIKLLRAEHNDQLMLHSCRALCYLMEALPRSASLITDAIPPLLEKLENIIYIDVAEQALSALELLASQKHAIDVLECGGVSTVLQFYDFFSVNAKRSALNVAASCCTAVSSQNFPRVVNGLPILTQCLNPHGDRRALEAACNAFSRLAENLKSDSPCMRALTEHGLLLRIQELLLSTPPCLTEQHMKNVLHTLGLMAQFCPSLGAQMFVENFGSTLNFLIGGSSKGKLAPETQQVIGSSKFFEILYCLSELMPSLPKSGIFAISSMVSGDAAMKLFSIWEWEEDDSTWHPYSPTECRMLEAAFQQGQKELMLPVIGRQYSVNFSEMTQINRKSGTERSVRRQRSSNPPLPPPIPSDPEPELELDPRECAVIEHSDTAHQLFQSILPLLFEVLNATSGCNVQQKCLQTIIRMVRVAECDVIKAVLHDVPVSSYLAALLACKEVPVLIPCLQLSSLLLEKIQLFAVYFRKEGVVHQIEQLKENPPINPPPPTATLNPPVPSQSLPATLPPPVFQSLHHQTPQKLPPGFPYVAPFSAPGWSTFAPQIITPNFLSQSAVRPHLIPPATIATALPPRVPPAMPPPVKQPDIPRKGSKTRIFARRPQFGSPPPPCPIGMIPSAIIPPHPESEVIISRKPSATSAPQKVPIPHDHIQIHAASPVPPLYGYTGMPASAPTGPMSDTPYHPYMFGHNHKQQSVNRNEKVRQWLIDTTTDILSNHFSDKNEDGAAYELLNQLKKISSNLCLDQSNTLQLFHEFCGLITEPSVNVSSFELTHSNLVHQLLRIFSCSPMVLQNRIVWQEFLHVFFLSPTPNTPLKTTWELPKIDTLPVLKLVQILQNCVNQSEQFSVKSDLGGSSGSQQFFRFINNHQIKCQLVRHQSDKQSKEWKKRPIQVDPLATLYSVEKYLVMRGLSRDQSYEEGESSDDGWFVMDTGESGPSFEFLLNDKVLPHNITIFEVVRKMRVKPEGATQSEDTPHIPGSFFLPSFLSQTLTLHYRQITKTSHLSKKPATRQSARLKQKTKEQSDKSDTNTSQLWSKTDEFLERLFTDILKILNFDWTVQDPSMPFIKLLSILCILSEKWYLLYSPFIGQPLMNLTAFHNHKLSAKVERIIQEPMTVLTATIPPWIRELSKICPSILSFPTRRSLFYCTAFDRARAMLTILEPKDTIIDTGEVSVPRIPKRKLTVSREDLLDQAIGVLNDTSVNISMLEVRFKDEVGTGLGPTLEFYSLVSLEVQKRVLGLWHDTRIDSNEFYFSPNGLYPSALFSQLTHNQQATHLCHFQFLGRLFAKSILDAHMLDLNLSPVFYYWLLNQENRITPSEFSYVDNYYKNSINSYLEFYEKSVDIHNEPSLNEAEKSIRMDALTNAYGGANGNLDISFIVPGSNDIELVPGGTKRVVSSGNVREYILSLINWILIRGVKKQMQAFIDGFTSIIALENLSIFHPIEIGLLTGGRRFAPWTKEELHHHCRLDHGYTHSSKTIGYLFNTLASYSEEEQRNFLQFVTGSPRLPIGGFAGLTPSLTIVKKQGDASQIPDSYLPSVMTCVNYLKLPEFTSEYILREKLFTAMTDGQKAFHLS